MRGKPEFDETQLTSWTGAREVAEVILSAELAGLFPGVDFSSQIDQHLSILEELFMLTIFAIPKAFRGHTATIQRNAITSWTMLHPRPEILLFGNESGTEEICRELEARSLRYPS